MYYLITVEENKVLQKPLYVAGESTDLVESSLTKYIKSLYPLA